MMGLAFFVGVVVGGLLGFTLGMATGRSVERFYTHERERLRGASRRSEEEARRR